MANDAVLLELEITKNQDAVSGKFTLDIRVIRYENIQSEIFVYRRDALAEVDYFDHIATTADLTTLPKSSPERGQIFFVVSVANLEFDTAQNMNDTEQLILLDVKGLKENYSVISDQLNSTYNVII